jgi:acyl CoA:acetate/3-ketoacid CoA transferase beta subunit
VRLRQTKEGLVLEELAPGVDVEEVVKKTDAELVFQRPSGA